MHVAVRNGHKILEEGGWVGAFLFEYSVYPPAYFGLKSLLLHDVTGPFTLVNISGASSG